MRHVIIGTSAAGLAAAEVLRARDCEGSITLISEEEHLPYSRPLLTYLLGREIKPEKIFLKSANFFTQLRLKPVLGEPVVRVNPETCEVSLGNQKTIAYDRLLIASGASSRLLDIPGLDFRGVYTLRHLSDVDRLEAGLPEGGTIVVVGAGAVGLKVADSLVSRGLTVHLLARGSQPLTRILDRVSADLLIKVIKEKGIDLYLHSWPEAVLGKYGQVTGVALNDNRELAAQAVIFSVGVEPRVEFLAGTGLAEAGGIRVDSFMRTGVPKIFAAGDCCLPRHLITGQPAAFHIWPAAVAQGQVAGANMAGGRRLYDGILPQNSISLKGFRIITGGHFTPDTVDGEIYMELDLPKRRYRRLVFQESRLVGVTLVGDVEQAGIYFQIMAQKLPITGLVADPRGMDFHPGRLWG
jgi:NAD(P)H-nitrite reductase large subunit